MNTLHIPAWFRPDAGLWLSSVLIMPVLLFLMLRGQLDLLCATLIASTILLFTLIDRADAALLTFSYLILMGDIRRIVSFVSGPFSLDLLLLVGPLVAALLALPLLLRARLRDGLSKAMLLLLVIMLLQVFNPKQGGLAIGLSGAIFYIAPMLWFWVGRRYGSPNMVRRLVHRVLIPLGVLAAILGMAQTRIGFLPWEQDWVDHVASVDTSLHVGNSIRAFGFSVSSAEYATLLTIAIAAIVAASFVGRRCWAMTLPLLIVTLILASSRGDVLKLIIAIACSWTFRKGTRGVARKILVLILSSLVGVAGVGTVASHFAPQSSESKQARSAAQNAMEHQAGGLAHPFDPRYSTAALHGSMFLSGIVQGFTSPIGKGLGSTTLAAQKFLGDLSFASSEVDLSDMFIALGFVGGITYLFVICATAGHALRYLHNVPRSISLPVVAILMCTFGSWLIGGQYSTASILFFLIGGLVYSEAAEQRIPMRSVQRPLRQVGVPPSSMLSNCESQ